MRNLIKENLAIRRKSLGWLAKKTAIDRSYLSKLINGKAPRPSIATGQKIAKAFDTTIEKLWIFP